MIELITRWKRRWALHLVFWVVTILGFYAVDLAAGRGGNYWFALVRALPVDIAATYFTAYIIVERVLQRRRYWLAGLLFVVSALAFTLISRAIYYYYILPVSYPEAMKYPLLHVPALVGTGFGMYLIVFLFTSLKLYRNWNAKNLEQRELEKQNLHSELALLRAQINPHFLFNTLNNIDALVFEDPQRASDSIVQLSGIMRYMLYDANAELVPLEKEIASLRSYIDLYRLRLRSPDFIRFREEGQAAGQFIPPMLLLPFVENAFKHGSLQGADPGIDIELQITPETYVFSVSNRRRSGGPVAYEASSGVGLQNVRRRLDIIYPKSYNLDIQSDEQVYRISLRIPATVRRTDRMELLLGTFSDP